MTKNFKEFITEIEHKTRNHDPSVVERSKPFAKSKQKIPGVLFMQQKIGANKYYIVVHEPSMKLFFNLKGDRSSIKQDDWVNLFMQANKTLKIDFTKDEDELEKDHGSKFKDLNRIINSQITRDKYKGWVLKDKVEFSVDSFM